MDEELTPFLATPEIMSNESTNDDSLESSASTEPLDEVDETRVLLERLVEQSARLERQFDVKLKYDEQKNRMIDALYAENREYKNDLVWKLKKELVAGLIEEIDDAEKRWSRELVESPFPTEPEALEKLVRKLSRYVCEELPENLRALLDRLDVFSFRSAEGTPFDPKRQRALKRTTTESPEQDRTIRSLRAGYYTEREGVETIVRPELVEVFRYVEKEERS